MKNALFALAFLFMTQFAPTSVLAEPKSKPDSKSSPSAKDNPLMTESSLPYHMPAFDKIKDEHFLPAIEAGRREQLQDIAKIASNTEKPTFENTIVAMERTGR